MEARHLSGIERDLPDLDDHLVQPERRAEIVRGRLVMTPPADAPHAKRHSRLDYVLSAHVVPPFEVAADMLTRTSLESDFAPDVSVSRHDPETGKRMIAELAFEVVSSQSLSIATDKARELILRGTRRVFCLRAAQDRVLEWSAPDDDWMPLAAEAQIDDACFARPIAIAGLLDAARADAAVVAALDARGVPELREIEARGLREGLRRRVVDLCVVLGIVVDGAMLAELDAMDADALGHLGDAIRDSRRWPR